MGDFWPGNVLVKLDEQGQVTRVFVVDWELAKPGVPGVELGGFCSEINTLRHFCPDCAESATELIAGFLKEYSLSLSNDTDRLELARTTLSHIGAHTIAVCPRAEWISTNAQTQAIVREGIEMMVKGDKEYLLASIVRPLIA
jgi:thiamine kinase-like enzyme